MRTTDKPILQSFHIEGVKHISPTETLEAISKGDAVLIDVREVYEVSVESIPLEHVLNHPMSVIMDRLAYIAKDQNIILACTAGVRSSKVANMLTIQGYPSVANLDGGLREWKAKGLPFDSDLPAAGCGCNSGTASKIGYASPKKDLSEKPNPNTDFKNLKII